MKNQDKEFHKIVCSYYNYQCQVCGKSFDYPMYFGEDGVNNFVCAHHRKSKASRPDLRNDKDNGVCVCFKCHERLHRGLCKV